MRLPAEFTRRLELVRQHARLNSGRTRFTREERNRFIVAATLFSTAELRKMVESAEASARQTQPSNPGSAPA